MIVISQICMNNKIIGKTHLASIEEVKLISWSECLRFTYNCQLIAEIAFKLLKNYK